MQFSPKQREALRLIAEGRFFPALVKEDDGWHARWRAVCVDNGWVDEYVRESAITRLSEDAEEQHHESLHDAWMMALKSRTGLVAWNDAECVAFARELDEWSGTADEDRSARAAICFAFRPFSLSCEYPKGKRGLKALGQAIYVFPQLCGMRHGVLELSRQDAEEFLRCGARNLRDAGYTVTGVDISAEVTAEAEVAEDSKVKLTVKVAGQTVTADEIRFLLEQGSSIVCFRDHWIEVDRGILKEALRALERGIGKKANAVGFALGIGHVGMLEIRQARAHGWLRGLLNELRNNCRRAVGEGSAFAVSAPEFVGELRDYQRRGVEWMKFLTDHGFGALLADDMGLGKTVQTIAWMLSYGKDGHRLIVAPLTLLSNWSHELKNFAPSLKVYVHQGNRRHFASGFARAVRDADVTLTSYSLLVRDYSLFAEVSWDALVLDEAQVMKNPDTQIAKALRALMPPRRVALSGTPIENSVADIWSMEEFLNPGFLGDRDSFHRRFVKPIAINENSAAGKRLRHALEPFVLRRLKSDDGIAAELGEKREIREYCALSEEQRRDYETALADFRATDHTQGDAFALITRLKLICDGAGKLERLCELLETIFANGESALVFTQYAKIGAWLQNELKRRFSRKFPFLHGGLSIRDRERQIADFNRRGKNAFILSLKAGGFGLNLTRATHVIHFDRWWNPAVENQATDRAHRIGQTSTVFVHLFISVGTLEEHVDDILRQKCRVAGAMIQNGESFIAEMIGNKLNEVVELDPQERQ